jgi:hypothetical protein
MGGLFHRKSKASGTSSTDANRKGKGPAVLQKGESAPFSTQAIEAQGFSQQSPSLSVEPLPGSDTNRSSGQDWSSLHDDAEYVNSGAATASPNDGDIDNVAAANSKSEKDISDDDGEEGEPTIADLFQMLKTVNANLLAVQSSVDALAQRVDLLERPGKHIMPS